MKYWHFFWCGNFVETHGLMLFVYNIMVSFSLHQGKTVPKPKKVSNVYNLSLKGEIKK